MSRTIQTRGGTRLNFDTVYPDFTREVSADGISEVMLGFPLSKLIFYQTRPVFPEDRSPAGDDGIERREVSLVLSMPTEVLIESLANILKGVATNSQNLSKTAENRLADLQMKLGALNSRVSSVPPPPATPRPTGHSIAKKKGRG